MSETSGAVLVAKVAQATGKWLFLELDSKLNTFSKERRARNCRFHEASTELFPPL